MNSTQKLKMFVQLNPSIMLYTSIIFICLLFIICVKLKIENNLLKIEKWYTTKKVKQKINRLSQKQLEIFDKVAATKSFNVDLNTEIKELSKEVAALHQDFIKKYVWK